VGSQATGFARLSPIQGDISTPANEADLGFTMFQTDVRSGTSTGPDYAPNPSGPDMTLVQRLRITDNANGGSDTERATTKDLDFAVPVDCVTTMDASIGSTCSTSTSATSLMPGVVVEGNQMNLQVFRVGVNDAGVDGVPGNANDRLFEQQGLFVP
jgi:hypothetical protein